MGELAEYLAAADRGETIKLEGCPRWGQPAAWHVVKSGVLGGGRSIMLERADGDEQWLTVTVKQESGSWSIEELSTFEESSEIDAEAIEPAV